MSICSIYGSHAIYGQRRCKDIENISIMVLIDAFGRTSGGGDDEIGVDWGTVTIAN